MLIFPNGTAYFNEPNTKKDIDENGLPVKGGDMSISAPCFIETSNEDRRGHNDDGAYPRFSFSIQVDYGGVDIDNFKPTRVRLEHERKGDLGTFTIQRIEYYNITQTIQIWV